MQNIILFSLLIASVSFTITVTSIFRPVRELVSRIHPKVEELFHCPYCLGHWLLFGILPFSGVRVHLIEGGFWVDFFATVFTIMGLVAIMHFLILRAYEPVMRSEMIRKNT